MPGTPPQPLTIVHFTHISHLWDVAQNGVLCDTHVQAAGYLLHEAGNTGIKARRRTRRVAPAPSGVVADYVPIYYAPRSPMMFSIHMGNVPTYAESCDDLIYLVTTVEQQIAAGRSLLFTDRNAVLDYAQFTSQVADLPELIDWPLMQAYMWKNTSEHPDRMERRMAECLVHEWVSFESLSEIVTSNEAVAGIARDTLARLGGGMKVNVRPNWYF